MINTQEYFLANGLKVILKDVPNSTVSSVFIWVKTGSAYENDYERGLAHVHEHMIFKGTSKLGVGEISKKIESYGGDVNAFTSNPFGNFVDPTKACKLVVSNISSNLVNKFL